MNDTNKICEQYISQVKSFFPIIGKKEKDYLQKLQTILLDYCEQCTDVSMHCLYDEFGTPPNIVANYFSDIDINDIFGRIRKDKSLKLISSCLIICIIVVLIGGSIKTRQYFVNYDQAINDDVYYYDDEIK